MKSNEDDFTKAVTMALAPPERDLPSSFPTAQNKETFKVKYARFFVGDNGSPELETIINDCLVGKYILASEQMHFTKEGDVVIVVKYLIPTQTSAKAEKIEGAIRGRRRLKKALEKDKK